MNKEPKQRAGKCPTCGSTNIEYYHDKISGQTVGGQCQDCGQVIELDAVEKIRTKIAGAFARAQLSFGDLISVDVAQGSDNTVILHYTTAGLDDNCFPHHSIWTTIHGWHCPSCGKMPLITSADVYEDNAGDQCICLSCGFGFFSTGKECLGIPKIARDDLVAYFNKTAIPTVFTLLEAKMRFGDSVVIITDECGLKCEQDAVIINIPWDVGDLWQFQRPDGSVFALNPYSSSFIRIEKAPRS